MYCWPRLLVKIDPKRSFFTFGPPPFRPEIRRRLPLGFSWAALGLLLAAPGVLLAAPGLLLAGLRLLLGFSWRLLGCSWASPGCSWAAPGCSWLLLVAPGLLLGCSFLAAPWLAGALVWPEAHRTAFLGMVSSVSFKFHAGGVRPRRNRIPKSMSNLAPKKIRQFWLQRWGFRVITGDPVCRCLFHTLWYF